MEDLETLIHGKFLKEQRKSEKMRELYLSCSVEGLLEKGHAGSLMSSNVFLVRFSLFSLCLCSCFLISSHSSLFIEGTKSQTSRTSDTNIADNNFWKLSGSDTLYFSVFSANNFHNTTQTDRKIPVTISLKECILHRCCLEIQRIMYTKCQRIMLPLCWRVRGLKKDLERSSFHLLGR